MWSPRVEMVRDAPRGRPAPVFRFPDDRGARSFYRPGRMHPFKQIDRYLAKLISVPLLGTPCLAAMLLLMDRMLRLFDFVVSEGGPVTIVRRMLANLIPEYLVLSCGVGLS